MIEFVATEGKGETETSYVKAQKILFSFFSIKRDFSLGKNRHLCMYNENSNDIITLLIGHYKWKCHTVYFCGSDLDLILSITKLKNVWPFSIQKKKRNPYFCILQLTTSCACFLKDILYKTRKSSYLTVDNEHLTNIIITDLDGNRLIK